MRPHRTRKPNSSPDPGTGLTRALSKLGFCSRSQARNLIVAGQVRVNGSTVRDPERRVAPGRDQIEVDGQPAPEEIAALGSRHSD